MPLSVTRLQLTRAALIYSSSLPINPMLEEQFICVVPFFTVAGMWVSSFQGDGVSARAMEDRLSDPRWLTG